MNRYTSAPGLFGETKYYDESGNCVGESWAGIIPGTTVHYGRDGSVIGSSVEGLFGETRHYDTGNRYAASSWDVGFGTREHYDSDGGWLGSTWESAVGDSSEIDFTF